MLSLTRIVRECLPIAALVSIAWCSVLFAADEAEDTFRSLKADFAAEKEYILDCPIDIVLTLQNAYPEPVRIPFYRDHFARFSVRDYSGKRVREIGKPAFRCGGVPIRTMEPGAIYSIHFYLNSYVAFERPGDYTVACEAVCGVATAGGRLADAVFKPYRSEPTVLRIKLRRGTKEEIHAIIGTLEKKTRDKDSAIREEAARALASMRIPEVVKPLGRVLRSGKPRLEYHVGRALARIGTDAAVDELVAAAQVGAHRSRREKAITWLGHSRSKKALGGLTELLDDPEADIRLAALRGISSLRFAIPLDNLDKVRGKLDDPDQKVSVAAAWLLERVKEGN